MVKLAFIKVIHQLGQSVSEKFTEDKLVDPYSYVLQLEMIVGQVVSLD